jgi:nucleoside-diphosphate-sugar epimerase
MKKAIIAGGAGFVGSAVAYELLKHNVNLTIVVKPGFLNSKKNNRLDNLDVNIIECDISKISELKNLISERDFDVYYHFAWDGLFLEALLDYTTQIMNIKWVMDAIVTASEMGCKKFVGAGSIAQYELTIREGQIDQNDKHKVYKTAKLACEYMGRSIAAKQGIQFFWPIITNIYGEGEKSPRLINTMIRNLLIGKRQKLSEGNQVYDFIHISDAARAFYLIGLNGKEFRTYVIGSGMAHPLKEFLCSLRDIVDPKASLGFGEAPFNGIYLPENVYDIFSLQEDTGFKAKVTFEDGIRRTMEWIKAELK